MKEGPALPRPWIPPEARRERITGSHVYGFLQCEHAVWLDFFGDPGARLPTEPWLLRLRERGREHEAEVLAGLDLAEPGYPARDFALGARATLGLMKEGVPGISQAVLLDPPFLGIPDLCRRVEGESRLGGWHYVVGDIKSSHRPRSDQALQVAFYSFLLAELQGRFPDTAFLLLRDGREERVDPRALAPVLVEILTELGELFGGGEVSRPHRCPACADCAWREVCKEEAPVHWLPGLTRTQRRMIEGAGYGALDSLRRLDARALGRGGLLPAATWQRARWGAEALGSGRALPTRRARIRELVEPLRPVLACYDGFDGRPLLFASLEPGGRPRLHPVEDQGGSALESWMDEVRGKGSLGHSGGLPGLLFRLAMDHPGLGPGLGELENRCLDLCALARGCFAFPAPVRTAAQALAWIRGREPVPGAPLAFLLEQGEGERVREAVLAELQALGELHAILKERGE